MEKRPLPPPKSPRSNASQGGIAKPFQRAGTWARDTAKEGLGWFRKRPAAVRIGILAGGAAVLLLIGLAVAGVFSDEPSAADLQASVKANPKDPSTRLALGHALFREGKRADALDAYERALALDAKAADAELMTNLAASFGDREAQPMAAVLIVRHKLVQIEDQLDDKTTDERHWVRWPALYTLEKLGRASDEDQLNALRADLRDSDCDLRRKAVAKLDDHADPGVKGEVQAAVEKNKACPRVATPANATKDTKAVAEPEAPKAKAKGKGRVTTMSPI